MNKLASSGKLPPKSAGSFLQKRLQQRVRILIFFASNFQEYFQFNLPGNSFLFYFLLSG